MVVILLLILWINVVSMMRCLILKALLLLIMNVIFLEEILCWHFIFDFRFFQIQIGFILWQILVQSKFVSDDVRTVILKHLLLFILISREWSVHSFSYMIRNRRWMVLKKEILIIYISMMVRLLFNHFMFMFPMKFLF